MNEAQDQAAASRADSTWRGDELVAAALILALVSFAGPAAVGFLVYVFVAGKIMSGSRAAFWVLSLAALAWGVVQLSDIVKGNHGDQHLSVWVLIWTRCLCGFAAPAILFSRKALRCDVPLGVLTIPMTFDYASPRNIGRLTFRDGLKSMVWTATSLGAVAIPIVEILRNGGFTPQTSIFGIGARVFLIVVGIVALIRMCRRGEIGWRPPAR